MSQPDQTRKDMLIFNGAAWFYILLGWYTLQSAVSLAFEVQPGGILQHSGRIEVWLGAFLMVAGGSGQLIGVFHRPRWTGWPWIFTNMLAMVGQYVYSDLYRASWLVGRLGVTEWADEFVFSCWLAVGLLGALVDTFKTKK